MQRPDHAHAPLSGPERGVSSAAPRLLSSLALGLALGVAGAVVGSSLVAAGDDAGIYQMLRFDALRRQQAAPPAPPLLPFAPGVDDPSRRGSPRIRAGDRSASVPMSGHGASRRTICVRLCDGYQFPVDGLRSSADLPEHEAICKASCPAAPTKLFMLDRDSDGIGDAKAADGTIYARLPMAHAYLSRRDQTCSCQGPTRVAKRVPITQDMTLRRGDIVVDGDGAKVFTGEHGRHRTARSFEDFRHSKLLSRGERRQVDALLGVSRTETSRQAFRHALEVSEARRATR